MSAAKQQHNNILLAIIGFAAVVIIVALIGFFALGRDPELMQGQVEVSEYRVSSKVPGRILEIRVKEGDYVKVGDTLAIIDAPEVRAKMEQARGAESAAAALELKAQNGAREEQVRGGDLVQPLLEGLVRRAAQQGRGGARRPDPALLLPGNRLLGEDLRVDGGLERVRIDAAGGKHPAGVVVAVAQHSEHDVVRPDRIASGAHRLVAGIAEDGLQVCRELDLHGRKYMDKNSNLIGFFS